MEVILLERVAKLGQMGDVVRVMDGFARNFLLPKGKALRATKENRPRFHGMKAELEARNLSLKGDAGKLAAWVAKGLWPDDLNPMQQMRRAEGYNRALLGAWN